MGNPSGGSYSQGCNLCENALPPTARRDERQTERVEPSGCTGEGIATAHLRGILLEETK